MTHPQHTPARFPPAFGTHLALAVLIATVSLTSISSACAAWAQPNLTYSKIGDTELKLDFVRPDGDGPFPLVVCIHGGGWRGGSRADFKEMQQHMALMGFATASVQYRLTPKYQFPDQLNDVQAAISFLAENRDEFKIDPQRVATFGGSAGGHLALLTGFTASPNYRVRGIVNLCGPTDLRNFQSTAEGDQALKQASGRNSNELLEDLLGTSDRTAKVYAEASPVTHVSSASPAVLTLHGTHDDLVPISQAELLHAALKEKAVTEQLLRVEGGGHDMGQWPEAGRNKAIAAALQFFQKHLANAD